jgi:hypothetical protein
MKRLISVLAVILLAAAFVLPLQAQDEMTPHVCDSTLIALLYVAEYHYGFHSMEMDLSTFEKGQYAPLFDSMMSMMDEDEMMATEEAMMEDDMMATEEAMMDGEMVTLTPGNIEGEDEACTALRIELDAFLPDALKADMLMSEGS